MGVGYQQKLSCVRSGGRPEAVCEGMPGMEANGNLDAVMKSEGWMDGACL